MTVIFTIAFEILNFVNKNFSKPPHFESTNRTVIFPVRKLTIIFIVCKKSVYFLFA